MEDVSSLRQQRLDKLKELRQRGIDAYPYKYTPDTFAADIHEKYEGVTDIPEGTHQVRMAGRLMTKRDHGKSGFAHLQDTTDQIQIYVLRDKVGAEKYDVYRRFIDMGDIIGVAGTVFRTRKGEVTVMVETFELLCKTLRNLPEKWHGLTDIEIRYRQRYVDLMVNPPVREVFRARTQLINSIRQTLNSEDFLEVETPVLQPLYGGASAQPFTTHHNALDRTLYLRISNELYLKRLVAGGFDRVYEFSRDFRNEGIDRDHSPEFTMMEVYQAYADYHDMMNLAENLIVSASTAVQGTTQINYQGNPIDLTPPWKRLKMVESIKAYTDIDTEALTDSELRELAAQKGLELENATSRGKLIALFFDQFVEPQLIEPTFIIDYPIEISPLAKKKRGDDAFVERFEIFIGGMELGNAFSELNDPLDQQERFLDQMKQRESGDEEAQMLDEDYVRALEYGMPPTGGLGIGIDRLTMLLTDQSSIRDVILFPQMRPES
jgi:lysyl-tRNA synthetase class 2